MHNATPKGYYSEELLTPTYAKEDLEVSVKESNP